MNNIVVVGSQAALHRGIDRGQELLDTDYICAAEDFKELVKSKLNNPRRNLQWTKPTESGMAVCIQELDVWRRPAPFIYEAEFIDRDNPSSRLFYDAVIADPASDPLFMEDSWFYYPSLDMLYLLKMSHRYKKNSPHFKKTMDDIHTMREKGAKIPDQELYQARMDATYGYSHPNLKRTKEEFFVTSGELKYEYDHDSLHEAVAHLDRPMYTYYAVDGEQVLSSRSKFDALPHEHKIYGVLEESYVLALERSVIPFGTEPDAAFMKALEKVCTSITSGWFRSWAYEHYYECLERYDSGYVDKFHKALAVGIVKPFSA